METEVKRTPQFKNPFFISECPHFCEGIFVAAYLNKLHIPKIPKSIAQPNMIPNIKP
jgi:hypothetical protein